MGLDQRVGVVLVDAGRGRSSLVTRTREFEPLCLTVTEAARAIRRDENEVRAWIRQGLLPHIRWTPTSHPLIP